MSGSLVARLWIYQAERFPLKKTVPLLAIFSAASITVSAVLADRPLPGIGAYLVGFGLAFLLFFQMRVCDEVKDLEDDRRYRPERPIPRGLVSLRLIVGLGLATVPLAAALAVIWGAGLIWLLGLVWLWLAAMTAEFGMPRWLKARPVLYLLSHMAIMPLIDLMLTGIEWRPAGAPHPGLWWFIGLSFANGCVLELGRKLWVPESELAGVETYSGLWGPRQATAVWLGFVALAFALLVGFGMAVGSPVALALVGFTGLVACLWAGLAYVRDQTVAREQRVDMVAGLWVFLCYAAAGFVPLILGAI
ncbi:UbiA family prenyltransferase [Actibacterium sp. 188UL27-1]|uniref:UbiA family prenyltransferase n=1 Tax=Actibacterium sp. 188UL27-1 TaxID=2786961 RepID=UPI00195D7C4A|nr:UbiA family prenyltransferase [Actibacterium sp. 188UL27-1]MBM7067435.1 UbiA family prenyltransferase [Actibacterium sp. 188UL27-1]